MPPSKRSKLTEADAIAIYTYKPTTDYAVTADTIAAIHGVHEKTVRDIWTGRTWACVTGARGKRRRLGRPRFENMSIDDLLFAQARMRIVSNTEFLEWYLNDDDPML